MNRRSVIALAAVISPLMAVAAACAFPDVSFVPLGDDLDGGFDGADTSALPDVIVVDDIAVRDDATARVDASTCDATCDCDGDGYLKLDCDAGEDTSGKKPGDCDDLDPLRHPDAKITAAEPVGHDGDWDCDGIVETMPARGIECGGTGLGCTGGSGFVDEPKCGTEGEFFNCERQENVVAPCLAKPTGQKSLVYCH